MADVFTIEKRSEVMSRIRSRGNKETELALVRIFREFHVTGWRRHVLLKVRIKKAKMVEGRWLRVEGGEGRGGRVSRSQPSTINSQPFRVRPDFVFAKWRLAVLVDGCFWHGCPRHANLPVGHRAFWRAKLASNRARDRRVNRVLRGAGWLVVRLWEHELRHPERCVAKVLRAAGEVGFKV